ncbi:hypothetical protein PseuLF5_10815 [Pseudomonas sp. LF-5]|nr:hypothetical protein [Pseudomonas monsensis]
MGCAGPAGSDDGAYRCHPRLQLRRLRSGHRRA